MSRCVRCGVPLTTKNRYRPGRFRVSMRYCRDCYPRIAEFGNRNVIARPLADGTWELYENGVKIPAGEFR